MNPERLTIYVGKEMDGFTFRLRPKSLEVIREYLKKKNSGTSPLPQVSIGYDVRSDFETIDEPIYQHIQELLTGVDDAELDEIGGVTFVDAATGKIIHESSAEHVS